MLKTARIHGKSLALAEGLAAILCLGAPAAVAQSKYIPPAQLPGQNGSSPPGQVPGQTNPVQLDPTPARCSTCDDSPGVNSNASKWRTRYLCGRNQRVHWLRRKWGSWLLPGR